MQYKCYSAKLCATSFFLLFILRQESHNVAQAGLEFTISPGWPLMWDPLTSVSQVAGIDYRLLPLDGSFSSFYTTGSLPFLLSPGSTREQ